MATTTTPILKWAQRKDKLFVTVEVPDATEPKVNLNAEGVLAFKAQSGDNTYSFEYTLNEPVDVEKSKWNFTGRYAQLVLIKKEAGPHWPRFTKEKNFDKKHIQVDWTRYVDEDEEDEKPAAAGGEEDMFGGMGGMGGMGGFDPSSMGGFDFGGMGGGDDSDDEDDEEPANLDDLDNKEESKGTTEESK
mmetsp:Transcript_31408/g.35719  ORF Transcript_31408/g.35719 Transcript_31408/m.35719 type:complete len:189 (-) Transcript_31408:6-572(-)